MMKFKYVITRVQDFGESVNLYWSRLWRMRYSICRIPCILYTHVYMTHTSIYMHNK